jgi:hypothetical protein
MIIESGENGLKSGKYHSIAYRDPRNGRIFIRTTEEISQGSGEGWTTIIKTRAGVPKTDRFIPG